MFQFLDNDADVAIDVVRVGTFHLTTEDQNLFHAFQ